MEIDLGNVGDIMPSDEVLALCQRINQLRLPTVQGVIAQIAGLLGNQIGAKTSTLTETVLTQAIAKPKRLGMRINFRKRR